MGVLVKVINTLRVEATGSPLQSMDLVALIKQKLSQVTAVLPCDPSDQGDFSGLIG